MRIPFSLIILALVFAEIAAFIVVGEAIGVLATLGLVLLGMIVGTMLLRRQGIATLMRVRADIETGRAPARPLAEGAVLAFAALLIILPGFVTDLIGSLLFIPIVRETLWRAFRSKAAVRSIRADSPPFTRGGEVDLEQSEYGISPRATSPWRRIGGPEA